MINIIFGIGLLLFSFEQLSCTDQKYKSNNEVNPYFPVNEIKSWKYVNEPPRKESEEFQIDITNITEQNQEYIIELNAFPFFDLLHNKTKLKIESNGEVIKIDSAGVQETFIPELLKINKNYHWSYFNWDAYITSLNEEVKTEDTTYNDCLLISYSIGFTFSTEIWFAKNTGIVKWGFNRTNPPVLKPIYYILKRNND